MKNLNQLTDTAILLTNVFNFPPRQRKEGLRGKPHLPYGRVERVIHESNKVKNEKRILPLHSRHAYFGTNGNRDMVPHTFQPFVNMKNQGSNKVFKPIQQPRKQN